MFQTILRKNGRMSDYIQYRRIAIAEIAPWVPGFDMKHVSVSQADLSDGSPREGDMIGRNPENHDDHWLIAADYFAANFKAI